jgi:hypothetical protein
VKERWTDLPGLKTLTMYDVELANQALDAFSDAQIAARKKGA